MNERLLQSNFKSCLQSTDEMNLCWMNKNSSLLKISLMLKPSESQLVRPSFLSKRVIILQEKSCPDKPKIFHCKFCFHGDPILFTAISFLMLKLFSNVLYKQLQASKNRWLYLYFTVLKIDYRIINTPLFSKIFQFIFIWVIKILSKHFYVLSWFVCLNVWKFLVCTFYLFRDI